VGDQQAVDHAIFTCLALPVSLAVRRRAIDFLVRIRYEDPPAPQPSRVLQLATTA
jgi:hypothetical protein